MFAKVVLFSCLALVVVARPDKRPNTYQPPQQQTYQPPQQPEPHPSYSNRQPSYQEPEEGMPFDYSYAVQDQYSGNNFGHNTNSDGKVTTGEYRVLLPDGRTQIVTYTADYNGFQAEVTYEGEARPYEPQPQASYNQPRPTYEQPQPRPTYEQPRPTYEPPQNTYQAPQQPQRGYSF
ncbi:extensin-like isoform X3 [Hyalella azteca]|uniref:Extensin-like isoform X2 n=1 Tax=Hyalella azteca TaxID=294128 RepID=A0A979FFS1_HYAAZ|nr:extensin-like isoform X2 [Hyalella azteca]XP_047735761.1 extensin-like isoform X3 [Hyalella azteca]